MAAILDGTNGLTLPTWTTSTRPASPTNGCIGLNTGTGYLEVYQSTVWIRIAIAHASVTANVLVVAGGGGGGAGEAANSGDAAGGGGAGGLINAASMVFEGATTYTVTVGVGGVAGTGSVAPGQGSNSSVTGTSISLTSYGGGSGGSEAVGQGTGGGNGGSGGGANNNYGASYPGGIGVYLGSSYVSLYRQGYDGGNTLPSSTSFRAGSGGGGAGGPGVTRSSSTGAAGGPGVSIDYSGDPVTYAAGGAGGSYQSNANGSAGATNTGNGGTGAGGPTGNSNQYIGGAGGSGIVIIQYPSPVALAIGGTITSFVKFGTTYQVHTYTTSGTFVTLAF